jgi:hypothetical protein
MEMNVEKTKILRISRQTFPLQITGDQKQLKNVEYVNYVCSMTTNDASCTGEIKSLIVIQQALFSKKRALFTSKLNLSEGKKYKVLYLEPSFVWTYLKVD